MWTNAVMLMKAGFVATEMKRRDPAMNLCLMAILLFLFWTLPASAMEKQEYLEDAHRYFENGEYRAAVIQLKNALLIDPDDGDVRLLLGKVYLKLNDGVTAEKELRRARALDVPREQVLPLWGRALLMTGRNSELLQAISHEAGDSPRLKLDILLLHGQAYIADQHYAMAEEKFSAALELEPDASEAMIGLARIAYLGGDTQGSNELVERALAINPAMTEAWVLRAILLRKAGKHAEAAAAVEKALAIDPSNLAARLEKATILVAQGRNKQALAEIEQIQHSTPGFYRVVYLKALAQYQQQQLTQAQESVRFILRQEPSHLPSILLAGAIAYHLGQLNQAHDHLQNNWKRDPGNRQAVMLLAATRMKLGQPDGAIQVLEPGVQAAAGDAQYLALLGSAHLAAGNTGEGIDYLERAVELSPDAAAFYVQLALGRMSAGDLDMAVSELQAAVDLGQDEVQADLLLVIAHLYNRDFDSALAGSLTLKEKMPESPVPDNLAGTALFGMDRPAEARDAFENSLRLQPAFLPSYFNLAQLAIDEGDTQQAKARYREILKHDEGNLKALLALADLARAANRADEAEQWLKQARFQHPQAVIPALRLVEHYQKQGDLKGALQVASEIAASRPDTPAVLMALGHTQFAAGEYSDARNTLRSLIELEPGSPEAHYLQGLVELKLGNQAAGRDSFLKAVGLRADYPAAQVMLGQQYIRVGDYEAARAVAGDLEKSHPEAAYGDELAGDIYVASGDHGKARDAYGKAYEKAASALLARKIYQSSIRLNDTRSAHAALMRWLEQHPDDVAIRGTLAFNLMREGRRKQAIEQFRLILEHEPGNVVALNNIAWLYQQEGDSSALTYAERAHELAPDRPDVMDTLGWLLVQNGEINRGLILLQEARVKAPHEPEIHFHMAVALHKAGRNAEARKELGRLLKGGRAFPGSDEAEALHTQLGG